MKALLNRLLSLLDFIRIFGVAVAFFFGYQRGFEADYYNPQAQLHFLLSLLGTKPSARCHLQ